LYQDKVLDIRQAYIILLGEKALPIFARNAPKTEKNIFINSFNLENSTECNQIPRFTVLCQHPVKLFLIF